MARPKIGIIFGSTTGNTEDLAYRIAQTLSDLRPTVKNVESVSVQDMRRFNVLIFGCSTWHHGELQYEWAERFADLDGASFRRKKVALFGSGDSQNYPDNFQDAMGVMYDKFVELGADMIGAWPVDEYEFNESKGVNAEGTHFYGLAMCKSDSSDVAADRVQRWSDKLRGEI